jgi:hypothetical protein
VVLLGSDYSASLSLGGLTPDDLILTMTADAHDYTDLETAIRHHRG